MICSGSAMRRMSVSTERTVNGLKVLATYPVHSPLSTEAKPVYFRRMERLELEFGNEVYACRECGHVDDSVGKIRGHLGKEHPSEKALANRERKREAASLPCRSEEH